MGMDVYGKNPSDKMGEYFRNSVWSWHPLWDYCEHVASEITNKVKHAHSNDGDGLNDVESRALAAILVQELDSGRTAAYKDSYDAAIAALPDRECDLCDGTGVRKDRVVDFSQEVVKNAWHPYKKNQPHPRHGQIGWCNACDGVGRRPDFRVHYGFRVDNVAEFIGFLKHCGGFEIR